MKKVFTYINYLLTGILRAPIRPIAWSEFPCKIGLDSLTEVMDGACKKKQERFSMWTFF